MEEETNCYDPYYSVVVVGTGSKCLNGNFLQRRPHHLRLIHHLREQSSLTARKLWLERLMHLSRKLIGGGFTTPIHIFVPRPTPPTVPFISQRKKCLSDFLRLYGTGGNVKFFPHWLRRRLGEIGVICGSGVGPTGDSTLLVKTHV